MTQIEWHRCLETGTSILSLLPPNLVHRDTMIIDSNAQLQCHMENSSEQIVLGSSQPLVTWPTFARYFLAKLLSHNLHKNRKNGLILINPIVCFSNHYLFCPRMKQDWPQSLTTVCAYQDLESLNSVSAEARVAGMQGCTVAVVSMPTLLLRAI